jgi:hypothetical protein
MTRRRPKRGQGRIVKAGGARDIRDADAGMVDHGEILNRPNPQSSRAWPTTTDLVADTTAGNRPFHRPLRKS